MARDGDMLFSVVIPTVGNRPRALEKAVASVEEAARFAGLAENQVEVLIGFDGVKGSAPSCAYPLATYNLPRDNDQGNGIRNLLLNLATGIKVVFLDDDNVLKQYALDLYLKHFDAEMIVGRIDTQLALERPELPVLDNGPMVRPGNIDLLNLCLSRRLVLDRCGGWRYRGRSDSTYRNIRMWSRRAHSMTVLEDVVGIFDAGRSLDSRALSRRQERLLDGLAAGQNLPPVPVRECREMALA